MVSVGVSSNGLVVPDVGVGSICKDSGPRDLNWRLFSLQCSQATSPSMDVVVKLVASSNRDTNRVVSLMLSWQLMMLCIWTPNDTNCQNYVANHTQQPPTTSALLSDITHDHNDGQR